MSRVVLRGLGFGAVTTQGGVASWLRSSARPPPLALHYPPELREQEGRKEGGK